MVTLAGDLQPYRVGGGQIYDGPPFSLESVRVRVRHPATPPRGHPPCGGVSLHGVSQV